MVKIVVIINVLVLCFDGRLNWLFGIKYVFCIK